MNETVKASKRQQEDSNPGSLDCGSDVLTTAPSRPTKFHKSRSTDQRPNLSTSDRTQQTLQYFVTPGDARDAIGGRKLDEVCVETRPDMISAAMLVDHINISTVLHERCLGVRSASRQDQAGFTSLHFPVLRIRLAHQANLTRVGRRTKPKTKVWFCQETLCRYPVSW